MNNTPYHPSKHQSGDDSRRIASSGASASFEALELEAKISSLEMLRVRMASEYSSPSKALSQDTAAAADKTRVASDMQILRIPTKTKSEDCKPGPTLNPASCASGLALLGGGGGEGSDWISALSLTTLVAERMNGGQGQGYTRRRNSSLQNEDWGDLLHLPQAQGNLFLGDR